MSDDEILYCLQALGADPQLLKAVKGLMKERDELKQFEPRAAVGMTDEQLSREAEIALWGTDEQRDEQFKRTLMRQGWLKPFDGSTGTTNPHAGRKSEGSGV